jgi:Ser/Thr protein kinase RdoA (MazF antagonist)
MDSRGREILSYLEGETWPDSGSGLSDDLLERAARAIQRYHDTTVGSSLAQGHEIVAHHELGPYNTTFQGGHLVGFMDWDNAAPGTRLRDLANAVYNYVDVSHWANHTAEEQARRIHLMCAAYGWEDPLAIINDFEADLQQALRNHEQAGRAGAIKIFAEEVDWMRQRAQELRLAFQ